MSDQTGRSVMPAIPYPDLDPLVGSWLALSFALTFTDTKERVEPFGPDPDGRMMYDPGGRIMFLFTKRGRQTAVDEAARATQFNEMTAYTGLVRSDSPGRFITTVDLAWTPAFGGEQLRLFTIEGDRLTIRTPEQTIPKSQGRLAVAEVTFLREHLASFRRQGLMQPQLQEQRLTLHWPIRRWMRAARASALAAIERLGEIILEGGGFMFILIGALSSAE
jgi:hypothetical protein